MDPVIGISCGRRVVGNGEVYLTTAEIVEAVRAYGGIPIILPGGGSPGPFLDLIDGLILPGGGDVDPDYFGQEPRPGLRVVDPERDELEMGLIKGAWERKLPILGICRGMQILNVALGGELDQDLQGGLQHEQQGPRNALSHWVQVEDSLLRDLMGEARFRVNSFHHQGVSRVAPPLRAVATSSDGLVEAIAGPGFVLGVQWHPEWLWKKYPCYGQVFRGLIQYAQEVGRCES
ncbi:MAG: gamma-glutamyl-gamma-aminobutyrate hydrolase family protein [Limnochordia bacterium]